MEFLKLLLLFLPLLRASDTLLSPKGVNYDVAALMSMKSKLRDPYNVLYGWDINSVDPCTWSMIGCSPDGFVISLEMASKSLSGVLSPSIGNLSHLQMIETNILHINNIMYLGNSLPKGRNCLLLLQNNEISGPIPFEIGKLSGLQTLDLSGNQLMGEIPSSLGSLTHLSYLRLSSNNLSGQIPRAVADLIGLSFLDLSFNNFSGPIPRILAKEYSVAGNMFLCTSTHSEGCIDMPKPAKQSNSSQEADNHGFVVAISVSLSCALVFAVVLVVYCLGWWRWNILFLSDGQEDYEFEMGHLKRFSFRDLQVATDNFSRKNILGQGGFGVVYKGLLRNGNVVAVKRLKDPNFTGEVQFQTEVEMIGLVLHRNLLRLYGFCLTSNERLLVYPYMPNGSVSDRLRGPRHEKPSLDWNRRMRIALGAARGLLYLHEQCNPKIIHRDVKAANILLDESFEAIVGDFGLAKLLDRRDSHVTTAVRGTLGHIAPEYLSTGQSSEKTDVYGFGILILELVTGYKVLYTANGPFQKGMILDWVRGAHEEKNLDTLVDVDLGSSYNVDELEKAVGVALLCTQSDPSLRPRMSDVVRVLESMSGTTDHMDDSRGVPGERLCSFSRSYSNYLDESSFIVEAMELSGPR